MAGPTASKEVGFGLVCRLAVGPDRDRELRGAGVAAPVGRRAADGRAADPEPAARPGLARDRAHAVDRVGAGDLEGHACAGSALRHPHRPGGSATEGGGGHIELKAGNDEVPDPEIGAGFGAAATTADSWVSLPVPEAPVNAPEPPVIVKRG